MDDSFLTVAKTVECEIKEKGSRFIGHLHHCATVERAEEIITAYRKTYFDATHNCYGWLIGDDLFRYSDDGEPSGTAGKPIFQVLEGSGMKQLLCVVTRYYGGTKLGTGGLIRAYSGAAQLCLESANKKTVVIKKRFGLKHSYNDTSAVMHLIDKFSATVLSSEYGDGVHLQIEIRQSGIELFKEKLIEATAGAVKIED